MERIYVGRIGKCDGGWISGWDARWDVGVAWPEAWWVRCRVGCRVECLSNCSALERSHSALAGEGDGSAQRARCR